MFRIGTVLCVLALISSYTAPAVFCAGKDTSWFGIKPPVKKGEPFTNFAGMRMVWVPPGQFELGSPPDEPGRYDNEGPQNTVVVAKGFWMSAHEVTQKAYESVMGRNPSAHRGVSRPVDSVTWRDGRLFCRVLTSKDPQAPGEKGYRYELPSEAQWEYACRARFTGPTYAPRIHEIAWYEENSGRTTHPVGQLAANDWGLYDMLGNVREWCLDGRHDYQRRFVASDGLAPQRGSGSWRMLRGGSWRDRPQGCRAACRSEDEAAAVSSMYGFRCVAIPWAPPSKNDGRTGLSWREMSDDDVPEDFIIDVDSHQVNGARCPLVKWRRRK